MKREGFLYKDNDWLNETIKCGTDGDYAKAVMRNFHGDERVFTLKARTYPEDDTRFIVSFTDITEFEANKDELERQVVVRTKELSRAMSMLEEAQKIARLGYWQYSMKENICTYSKEICTMLGFDDDGMSMGASDALRFIYPDDTYKLVRSFIEVTRFGRNSSCNIRCINLQGKIITAHIHIKVPTLGQEEIVFGICQDIGEQIELEKIAYYDSLTQIYNRNKFNELITRELEFLRRHQQSLSIIIFDVDHFKNINDAYGHAVGDEVLMGIAKAVSCEIRSTDIFVRWGGEEFVIVAPQTSLEEAYTLAEKIRLVIADVIFSKGFKVTCSFGVTNIMHTENIENALKRADELLYEAKRQGRNLVIKEENDKASLN